MTTKPADEFDAIIRNLCDGSAPLDTDEHYAYGAAVAFGLMGMAEAIRTRWAVLPESDPNE